MAEFNENSLELYSKFFKSNWDISCFLNSELKRINNQILIINNIPFIYEYLKNYFIDEKCKEYIFKILKIYDSPEYLIEYKINELKMIIIKFLTDMEELFENENIKEEFKGITL